MISSPSRRETYKSESSMLRGMDSGCRSGWIKVSPGSYLQAIKLLKPKEICLLAHLFDLMEWGNQVPVGVSELKAITGWGRSSLQQRLKSLRSHGIIAGFSGRYMVNPKIAYFGTDAGLGKVIGRFQKMLISSEALRGVS